MVRYLTQIPRIDCFDIAQVKPLRDPGIKTRRNLGLLPGVPRRIPPFLRADPVESEADEPLEVFLAPVFGSLIAIYMGPAARLWGLSQRRIGRPLGD